MIKHFWKLEYSITLFVVLGLLMLFMPLRFENYIQLGMINTWNDKYEKVSYVFSVISAQKDSAVLKSYASAETPEQREKLLFQLVKPYLRLTPVEKYPWRYKPRYLDGKRVPKNDMYFFNELYYSGRQIVGIKDIKRNTENDAWFMMMFDINGILPPNTWGRDIFGIYIYNEGKVVPFGYSDSMDVLKDDCSKAGTGLDCSYYYTIGGVFDD